MKNLSLEQITKLEGMSKTELITSFNQYSAYVDNNLNLLVNVSTIDKSIYVAIMAKSMKQVEIVKATNLTKSHISRMAKVGKWILENREQYIKLVDTAGTKLNLRIMSDGIVHETIEKANDWASLVKAEENYKTKTKASAKATTPTPTTSAKPTSDKATPAPKPSTKAEPSAKPTTSAKPKNPNYRINDYERMNSTCVYQAIMRLINAYEESSDNLDYMNAFIERLNVLKH